MKRVWLLLVLLSVPVSAYLTMDAGEQGSNPSIYGDYFVFESGGQVKLYNLNDQILEVVGQGSYPDIFAYKIVFQSENRTDVVQFADVRKLQPKTIHFGRHPSVYSNTVAFSAKESELGVDYDNDGSQDDGIILFYDLDTNQLTNTKAVGDYPSVGKDFIIFETSENQFGNDLNGDLDMGDTIIRVYDFKRGVQNTGKMGKKPSMSPEGYAAFIDEGELVVYDVLANAFTRTGLKGSDPSVYEDVVIFSKEGKIATYDINKKTYAVLDVLGDSPSMFDLSAVFVSNGKIRYIKAQDFDKDGVVDLIDNCPNLANKNQSDADNDGIGDACDSSVKPKEKKVEKVDKVQTEEKESAPQEEAANSGAFPWWLLIILVPVIAFCIWYYPTWRRKRKKSFGF